MYIAPSCRDTKANQNDSGKELNVGLKILNKGHPKQYIQLTSSLLSYKYTPMTLTLALALLLLVMIINRLQPRVRPRTLPAPHLLPRRPILAIKLPKHFTGSLAPLLPKPPWHKFLAVLFSDLPPCSLALLKPILLHSREVVLAVFHGALIWSQPGICGCNPWSQVIRDGVQCQDKGCEVKGNACWSSVGFPD